MDASINSFINLSDNNPYLSDIRMNQPLVMLPALENPPSLEATEQTKVITSWTPEEDKKLMELDSQRTFTWRQIAAQIPNKSEDACRNRASKIRGKRGRLEKSTEQANKVARTSLSTSPHETLDSRQKWTTEEDVTLTELIQQGKLTRDEIATQLPGRTKEACSVRWRRLKPQIREQIQELGLSKSILWPGWNSKEHDLFLDFIEKHQLAKKHTISLKDWEELTKQLPGKSVGQCKGHWTAIKNWQCTQKAAMRPNETEEKVLKIIHPSDKQTQRPPTSTYEIPHLQTIHSSYNAPLNQPYNLLPPTLLNLLVTCPHMTLAQLAVIYPQLTNKLLVLENQARLHELASSSANTARPEDTPQQDQLAFSLTVDSSNEYFL